MRRVVMSKRSSTSLVETIRAHDLIIAAPRSGAFCDTPDHGWSVLNVGTFPSVGGTGSAYRQGRGSLGRSDHDTRSGRSPLIGS